MLFVSAMAWFVGGATMLGAVFGFLFGKENARVNGAVLAFAAGLMSAAALLELIAPALGAPAGAFYPALGGVALGAGFVAGLDLCTPLFRHIGGRRLLAGVPDAKRQAAKRVLLFVLAIAVHNAPEGFAAGVAAGGDSRARAFAVALGIALQNVPEGMVLIHPMLSAGLPAPRTLFLALSTGAVEVAGAYAGYFLTASPLSSFSLLSAFAGGAMLYIVAAEVLPEAAENAGCRAAGFGFLLGVCVMLLTGRLA